MFKKNTDFCASVLAPASFLTFGKVNPVLPQTDFFFFGEERGSQHNQLKPFWAPPFWAHGSPPPFGAVFFWVWSPPFGAPLNTHQIQKWIGQKWIGPKIGLALVKSGWPNANVSGGWAPNCEAQNGGGAQNFALLPPQFSFFLPSLGVFSWNFGVFEAPGP